MRKIRGMTLLEVLVAMTILSIALLAALQVLAAADVSTTKGDYFTVANQAAMNQIAEYGDMGAVAVAALDTSGNNTGTTLAPIAVAGLPSGSMSIRIGPLDGNAANINIEQVDIKVTWSGTNGAPQLGGQVAISTLLVTFP